MSNVLVAPLDWGLGHASRCIQIIRLLLEQDHNVIIAGDGRSLELLKQEFPELLSVDLPGYDITYSRSGFIVWIMLKQLPKIAYGIYREHKRLDEIIREHRIDTVISDNRFGLWSKRVPCAYMTHQTMIMAPGWLRFIEPILYRLHKIAINRYDECWIPDNEDEPNLSGDLTHKYPLPSNAHYIGSLTRFTMLEDVQPELGDVQPEWDLLAVISGPEPQRTIFEEMFLSQVKELSLKVLLIQGITEKDHEWYIGDNIKVVSRMTADELNQTMCSSKLVLMRSGYCGIMDIVVLGKQAIFVPTPGQTEQLYLADYFHRKQLYYSQRQEKFNLKQALTEVSKYKGILLNRDDDILKERIEKLISVASK